MKNLLAIGLLITLLTNGVDSSAAPDRVAFQLQQECRKSADDYFVEQLGSGVSETDDRVFYSNSTNHYNVRLNKCFSLIRSKAIYKTANEKANSYEDVLLQELSENTLYGHYRGTLYPEKIAYCDMHNSKCRSKIEFEKLLRPLMDN